MDRYQNDQGDRRDGDRTDDRDMDGVDGGMDPGMNRDMDGGLDDGDRQIGADGDYGPDDRMGEDRDDRGTSM
ncbi:hypothetical protein [Actinomadura parmotrematis]|uniref:Uncharacterized protein n=1 Tax=Actinomadura parmotrematis TaxID=2864039 RepID=A0ABS7FS03_9ACTN|nr:hypothetical protein [Actinomadura parmotrematis]MBW8482337.1 hypothetical protein [Actinomadura parmotrematis]